ncbi:hypothetical protein B0H13DRAFT_1917316 [Mycena leptocephala]|nr:hypothetical protein B0H13DRAFT_1917316 [Mycena leptocephala]
MFTKLFTLTSLFMLSTAAPLPVRSHNSSLQPRNGCQRLPLHATLHRPPGDTCDSVSIAFGLLPATLVNMNPEIGEDCTALKVGEYYCVQTVVSGNIGRPLVLNGFQ